jgi:hypothetical protein
LGRSSSSYFLSRFRLATTKAVPKARIITKTNMSAIKKSIPMSDSSSCISFPPLLYQKIRHATFRRSYSIQQKGPGDLQVFSFMPNEYDEICNDHEGSVAVVAQDYQPYEFTPDQALYQLDFYLKTLNLPFTVKDLYRKAYQGRLGPHYSDEWLDDLEHDPDVQEGMQEAFTTQSIIETLMRNGHEPIVRVLLRETRKLGIGFSQAYIVSIKKRK